MSQLEVTAEEDIEFDLLDKRLSASVHCDDSCEQIKRMIEVAGKCKTTSLSGICTELYNAGCHFNK